MSTVFVDDNKKPGLIKLGSVYGGWSFVDSPSLQNSTIVSCGLGEDASFDIDFANRYNARVVMVDPTPRAVQHYNKIIDALGNTAQSGYVSGGDQPVHCYELSNITNEQLVHVDAAMWTETGTVKFFPPPNPEHVSHSISNYQQDYDQSAECIEVPSTTLDALMADYGIESLPLLKLDIEGAEIQVLQYLMQNKIFPEQILVEYDELKLGTQQSIDKITQVHEQLCNNGYVMLHQDPPANFLYTRDSETTQ